MQLDETKERIIEMENGNKVHFKQDPRYGFWTVNFSKGGMPEILRGNFTQFMYAKMAVDQYLQSRSKNKTALKEE